MANLLPLTKTSNQTYLLANRKQAVLHLNYYNPSTSPVVTPVPDETTDLERHTLNEIAGKIQEGAPKEQNASAVLDAIVTHYYTLMGSGNIHSPHLPVLLQIALVVYIMIQKEPDDRLISSVDIADALAKLKGTLSYENGQALIKYQESDPAVLITKGIEYCNHHLTIAHKNVFFGLKENHLLNLLDELHPANCEYLSFNDLQNLSSTSKQQRGIYEKSWIPKLTTEGQEKVNNLERSTEEPLFLYAKQLFLENPRYRIDCYLPIDQKGIDYLQNDLQVNCGPLTIQKIRNGELTIKEAKERTEDKEERARLLQVLHKLIDDTSATFSEQYPNLHLDDPLKTADLDPFIKYLIDGSFPVEILEELLMRMAPDDLLLYFNDKAVQKYTDNGKFEITDLKAYEYEFECRIYELLKVLNDGTLQTFLDGQLKIERINPDFNLAYICVYEALLKSSGLRKYLENGKLSITTLYNILKRFDEDDVEGYLLEA